MRTAEPLLRTPISGAANAAAVTANAVTAFPGTLKQLTSLAGQECTRRDSHAPNIPSGLAITLEAIP